MNVNNNNKVNNNDNDNNPALTTTTTATCRRNKKYKTATTKTTTSRTSSTKKKKPRLDKENSHIAIIGCGLAGLSSAIALQQAGYQNIYIFERDESFEAQKEGYGLTLTYNTKGPLAKLGLLEKVAQQDCPSRSHYIFKPNGTVSGYFGNAFSKSRGLGQRGNLRVPRKVLRKILLDEFESSSSSLLFCTDNNNDNNNNNNNHHNIIYWNHELLHYKFDTTTNKYELKMSIGSTKTKTYSNIDLIIAADGIHSTVLQQMIQQQQQQSNNSQSNLSLSSLEPQHMGVRLILGISELTVPCPYLLNERGFYTMDGKHRLFIMPYQGSRLTDVEFENENDSQGKIKTTTRRIMWQLSFSCSLQECQTATKDSKLLYQQVLETCHDWHDPVMTMIQSTPIEQIWGTSLMDRDPQLILQLQQQQQQQSSSSSSFTNRIVFVGDALHSMSPFKGQGANQALQDGPLLASWLQRASIDAAIKGYIREAVQRTRPVVLASRQAAQELHSLLFQNTLLSSSSSFAGVRPECVENLLSVLKERNIGANTKFNDSNDNLDTRINQVIQELGVGVVEKRDNEENNNNDFSRRNHDVNLEQKALKCSQMGDTQELRQISLQHSVSIRKARDTMGRTCLHLAAINQHAFTFQWLVTEACVDTSIKDNSGASVADYIIDYTDETYRNVLKIQPL